MAYEGGCRFQNKRFSVMMNLGEFSRRSCELCANNGRQDVCDVCVGWGKFQRKERGDNAKVL